ncbi:hypothetical protein RLIN73S_03206 [Rhodanobacter lindaniclasticus]
MQARGSVRSRRPVAPDTPAPRPCCRDQARRCGAESQAEARDHLAMAPSIVEELGEWRTLRDRRLRVQRLEQFHRTLLQTHVLGMFQRQVGEYPPQRRQRLVETVGQPRQGDALRLDVGDPGARIAAMQVARKLVEQDQQRQPVGGLIRPRVAVLAPHRRSLWRSADGSVRRTRHLSRTSSRHAPDRTRTQGHPAVVRTWALLALGAAVKNVHLHVATRR